MGTALLNYAAAEWEPPAGSRHLWRRRKPGGGYEYADHPPGDRRPAAPEQPGVRAPRTAADPAKVAKLKAAVAARVARDRAIATGRATPEQLRRLTAAVRKRARAAQVDRLRRAAQRAVDLARISGFSNNPPADPDSPGTYRDAARQAADRRRESLQEARRVGAEGLDRPPGRPLYPARHSKFRSTPRVAAARQLEARHAAEAAAVRYGGRTDKAAQDVAESNEDLLAGVLAAGLGLTHVPAPDPRSYDRDAVWAAVRQGGCVNLPDNEACDVAARAGTVEHRFEVKTFLTNSTGAIKMNPFQRRRKDLAARGQRLIPVSQAVGVGPDEIPESYTVDGVTTRYVVRDDPTFDPGAEYRSHVVVIDHRADWAAHAHGERSIDARRVGDGNLYYQRGNRAWNKNDMVRADNPAALAELVAMPDHEFERVAARYAGYSFPSGNPHPPSPEMPKPPREVRVLTDLRQRDLKHRAAADRLANVHNRTAETDAWERVYHRQRADVLERLRRADETGESVPALERRFGVLTRRLAATDARRQVLARARVKAEQAVRARETKLARSRQDWDNLPPSARRAAEQQLGRTSTPSRAGV